MSSSSYTYLVLVRHGERLDEADREAWRRMRTVENQADPPLTKTGVAQASKAGRAIASKLDLKTRNVPVTLYSSPTARTIATATAIGKEIGVSSVFPAYGLNCCAAAKEYGVASKFFDRLPSDYDLACVQLACWPPVGDASRVDHLQTSGASFVTLVAELAAKHEPGEILVMVTHREGLWDLMQHLGEKPSCPYCSTHYVVFDHADGQIKRLRSVHEQKAEASITIHNTGVFFSPTLSRGKASIHHGRDVDGSRHLWRTPGVRGVWIAAVQDHEVVDLLSLPQASDGEEGDFVLVRLKSGAEGWAKAECLSTVQ